MARSEIEADDAGGRTDRAPDVSVIVPVYNVAAQLEQCLESLIGQTLPSLEIIVLDDGSTDASGAIARSIAARRPGRLRVVTKANGGCASARTAGLALARGVFVGFVDGDDWVSLDMFERLHAEATRSGADIAQCGYQEVYPDGTIVLPVAEARSLKADPAIVIEPIELAATRPTIWRRLYRRDFLRKNGIAFPAHIRSFDDTAFQFECCCRAESIVLLPVICYNYRQHRLGQDVAACDRRLFNFFAIFDWLDERNIVSAGPEAERQLVRVELDCHVWALGQIEPALRSEYRRKAVRQLGRRRSHLSRYQTIKTGCGMYTKASILMLRTLLARSASSARGAR